MARMIPTPTTLILVSSEADTAREELETGDFLDDLSERTFQTEHDLDAVLWRTRGTQIAIQLEKGGLLPHHLLSDLDPASRTIARRICEQARRHPRYPDQADRRPRNRRQRRSILWSEGLLPKTADADVRQSGEVARNIQPELWTALHAFLEKLGRTEHHHVRVRPKVRIGAIVSHPYRLHRIETELTERLGINSRPDEAYTRLDLPTDSIQMLNEQMQEERHCR